MTQVQKSMEPLLMAIKARCRCTTCNTPIESHLNERDLETMHVWDCTIENDLKELIDTTYTNKMHILFGSLSLKNFTIMHVWLGIVVGWVTFWEVSQQACEWVQSTLKSFMLVCGDNHWS